MRLSTWKISAYCLAQGSPQPLFSDDYHADYTCINEAGECSRTTAECPHFLIRRDACVCMLLFSHFRIRRGACVCMLKALSLARLLNSEARKCAVYFAVQSSLLLVNEVEIMPPSLCFLSTNQLPRAVCVKGILQLAGVSNPTWEDEEWRQGDKGNKHQE